MIQAYTFCQTLKGGIPESLPLWINYLENPGRGGDRGRDNRCCPERTLPSAHQNRRQTQSLQKEGDLGIEAEICRKFA